MSTNAQTYGAKTAKAIISPYCHEYLEVRDNGVWPIEMDEEVLRWKPACDLDVFDAPDPLEAPSLPVPFSADELAAFLLNGVGALASSAYGSWDDGPDDDVLKSMGILATKAREALRGAYAAYRNAERVVGKPNTQLDADTQQLAAEFRLANSAANTREGVFDKNLTDEEYRQRRERARASVQVLKEQLTAKRAESESAQSAWLRAMVNQLLRGRTSDAPAVAFAGARNSNTTDEDARQLGDGLTASHSYQPLSRAIEPYIDEPFGVLPETLRLRVSDAFFPMPAWDNLGLEQRRSLAEQHDNMTDPAMGPENEYWEGLAYQVSDVETNIEKWQLMNDRALPSEAVLKETQLTLLNGRLGNLKKLWKLPPFTVKSWDGLTDEVLAAAVAPATPAKPAASTAISGAKDWAMRAAREAMTPVEILKSQIMVSSIVEVQRQRQLELAKQHSALGHAGMSPDALRMAEEQRSSKALTGSTSIADAVRQIGESQLANAAGLSAASSAADTYKQLRISDTPGAVAKQFLDAESAIEQVQRATGYVEPKEIEVPAMRLYDPMAAEDRHRARDRAHRIETAELEEKARIRVREEHEAAKLAGALNNPLSEPSAPAVPTPESAPLPAIKKEGWVCKKAVLIKDNLAQWPTIEADFNHASENGLSEAAKATGHGDWFQSAALDWAKQRGKLIEPKNPAPIVNSVFALGGKIHTTGP